MLQRPIYLTLERDNDMEDLMDDGGFLRFICRSVHTEYGVHLVECKSYCSLLLNNSRGWTNPGSTRTLYLLST